MRASLCPIPMGKRVMLMTATTALAVLTAAAAHSAPAQAPEPSVAAWRVECSGDGKALECRAVQQVFQRETRQLVLSAVVRPAPDAKTGAMLLTLPLGLNLTEPVTVKVDNGAAERQPIQTCTNVGCFISMTLNDKFLASLRSGKDLKITVQDSSKKPLELSLPLLGFGLAYDKVKS